MSSAADLKDAQVMRRIAIGDYTRAAHAKTAPDEVIKELAADCCAWDATVLRLAKEAAA